MVHHAVRPGAKLPPHRQLLGLVNTPGEGTASQGRRRGRGRREEQEALQCQPVRLSAERGCCGRILPRAALARRIPRRNWHIIKKKGCGGARARAYAPWRGRRARDQGKAVQASTCVLSHAGRPVRRVVLSVTRRGIHMSVIGVEGCRPARRGTGSAAWPLPLKKKPGSLVLSLSRRTWRPPAAAETRTSLLHNPECHEWSAGRAEAPQGARRRPIRASRALAAGPYLARCSANERALRRLSSARPRTGTAVAA